MLMKRLLGLVFAGALAFSASAAAVYIRGIREAGTAAQPRVCVAIRVPPLGRARLQLESRTVGTASARTCPLGIASLCTPKARLGLSGRTLALAWQGADNAPPGYAARQRMPRSRTFLQYSTPLSMCSRCW